MNFNPSHYHSTSFFYSHLFLQCNVHARGAKRMCFSLFDITSACLSACLSLYWLTVADWGLTLIMPLWTCFVVLCRRYHPSTQWTALTLDMPVMFHLPVCIISQPCPFACCDLWRSLLWIESKAIIGGEGRGEKAPRVKGARTVIGYIWAQLHAY